MKKPKRKFELTIKIGADALIGLREGLSELAYEFDKQPIRDICVGGRDRYWTSKLEVNEGQTNEVYHEQLKKYLLSGDK